MACPGAALDPVKKESELATRKDFTITDENQPSSLCSSGSLPSYEEMAFLITHVQLMNLAAGLHRT